MSKLMNQVRVATEMMGNLKAERIPLLPHVQVHSCVCAFTTTWWDPSHHWPTACSYVLTLCVHVHIHAYVHAHVF